MKVEGWNRQTDHRVTRASQLDLGYWKTGVLGILQKSDHHLVQLHVGNAGAVDGGRGRAYTPYNSNLGAGSDVGQLDVGVLAFW